MRRIFGYRRQDPTESKRRVQRVNQGHPEYDNAAGLYDGCEYFWGSRLECGATRNPAFRAEGPPVDVALTATGLAC